METIVSRKHIMHLSGSRGVRVTEEQIVELDGVRFMKRIWHDFSSDSEDPHHVDFLPEGK